MCCNKYTNTLKNNLLSILPMVTYTQPTKIVGVAISKPRGRKEKKMRIYVNGKETSRETMADWYGRKFTDDIFQITHNAQISSDRTVNTITFIVGEAIYKDTIEIKF